MWGSVKALVVAGVSVSMVDGDSLTRKLLVEVVKPGSPGMVGVKYGRENWRPWIAPVVTVLNVDKVAAGIGASWWAEELDWTSAPPMTRPRKPRKVRMAWKVIMLDNVRAV